MSNFWLFHKPRCVNAIRKAHSHQCWREGPGTTVVLLLGLFGSLLFERSKGGVKDNDSNESYRRLNEEP